VFLNLTRNNVNFTSVASTPNQTAVSTVLDGNQNALSDIVNNLLVLTNTGARQAFDSLSGVQHAGTQTVMLRQNSQFMNVLFNRFGGLTKNNVVSFNPLANLLLAYNGNNWPGMASTNAGMPFDGETELQPELERGWWMRGYGQVGDIDDTSNATGSDYRLFGTAVGIDTELRTGLIVGTALGVGNSNVDGTGYDADVTSYQLATYAGLQQDKYYLTGVISAGYHDSDTSRQITVGSTNSTAKSDYAAVNISTDVEGGKQIALTKTTALTPFAGIQYVYLHRDSFTETNAGTSNLAVRDQYENSLRTKLGVEISHTLKTNQGRQLTPNARVAYIREHLDTVSRIDAGFTNAPDATFTVDGPDLDRNRVALNIGVMIELNERSQFHLAYDAEIADSDDYHALSAAFQYRW